MLLGEQQPERAAPEMGCLATAAEAEQPQARGVGAQSG